LKVGLESIIFFVFLPRDALVHSALLPQQS